MSVQCITCSPGSGAYRRPPASPGQPTPMPGLAVAQLCHGEPAPCMQLEAPTKGCFGMCRKDTLSPTCMCTGRMEMCWEL